MRLLKEHVENALLAALLGISSFIATYLRDMSHSVDALNSQMVLILDRVVTVAETIRDHEMRLRQMESKK